MNVNKLEIKNMYIDTNMKRCNVSINKTSRYIIYINVVGGPKPCKIDGWDSVSCWFSHMFTTYMSFELDAGAQFTNAYTKTMNKLLIRLDALYSDKDLSKLLFNFVCVLPTGGGARIHYAGVDTIAYNLEENKDVEKLEPTDPAGVDITKQPAVVFIDHVDAITILNRSFMSRCANLGLPKLHNLEGYKLLDYISKYIIQYDNYLVAYCTAKVK